MAEIGRGGMNGAVIAIEEARGQLADALDAATPRRAGPSHRRRRPTATRPLTGPGGLHCAATSSPTAGARTDAAAGRASGGPDTRAASCRHRSAVGRPRGRPRRPDRRRARPSTARSASSTGATGGELSALVGVRRADRQALRDGARRPAASCRAAGSLTVGIGDPATLDRETVVRVAASAERRLGGRTVQRAGHLADPARVDGLDGDAEAVGRAGRPRRRRGLVRPADDLPRRGRVGAAGPRRADPGRAGRRRRRPDAGRRARRRSSARAPTSPATLSNRAANDVSPEVLADEARAIAEQHGLWIDVIEPGAGHRARAWACSWRSGGAATTRRG